MDTMNNNKSRNRQYYYDVIYALYGYNDPCSRRKQLHNVPKMQLTSHRALEFLQLLRGIAKTPANCPENLPQLLQPNYGESAFLP